MPGEEDPRPEPALGPPATPRGGMTRRRFVISAGSTVVLGGAGALASGCGTPASPVRVLRTSNLQPPRQSGAVSLEETLAHRRSTREFTDQTLAPQELSQLLWAAQGITASWGGRTSPSAGGLYPLELYVVTPDAYSHYLPEGHRLEVLAEQDLRSQLASAALEQQAVRAAPLSVVITGVEARTTKKYRARGVRYVVLEAGHAAQNLLLQAVALGLGAVPIGSFDDGRLIGALRLPLGHAPLYIVAVGHPRSSTPS